MRCVLQSLRGMGFAAVFCLPSPSSLLPGAVAPHPLFPLCLCCLCGLVAGWGFLRGVCLFSLWFFMVGAGRLWRIVLGCAVTCWGGKNARGR